MPVVMASGAQWPGQGHGLSAMCRGLIWPYSWAAGLGGQESDALSERTFNVRAAHVLGAANTGSAAPASSAPTVFGSPALTAHLAGQHAALGAPRTPGPPALNHEVPGACPGLLGNISNLISAASGLQPGSLPPVPSSAQVCICALPPQDPVRGDAAER